MRICYIASSKIPSASANSIQVMKMCEAFANAGVSTELIIPRRLPGEERVDDIWEYYGIGRKFEICHLPYPFSGKKLKEKYFALWASLYARILKPDLVYTRLLWAVNWCLRLGMPVVFEAHKFHQYKSSRAFPIFLKRRFSKNFLGMVLISNSLSDFYRKEGISEEQILLVPDGVDVERFGISISKEKTREEIGIPPEKKVACYCGHLYREKGVETIVSCARLAGDILFLIVGGSEEAVKKKKEETKDLENVLFTGFVPPSRVPAYLSISDVLLLPYTEDSCRKYLSPLKMFEYMASGLPVVASDIPTLREILQDGRNAVLVRPDNPLALKEGIEKVLADERLGQRIAREAAREVREYSWEKRAQKIINFVKDRLRNSL